MKRFFGKRRATRTSPGEPTAQPLCRLGALVFQLNNSDKLYWASPWASTRIAGCALSPLNYHPLEKRFSQKIGSPLAPKPNDGGCADSYWISFSLYSVFAEQASKLLARAGSPRKERVHPQPTGGLSAQVALLQSPILSGATQSKTSKASLPSQLPKKK